MKTHDPRCEGPNDQKLLDDVAEYGWHVMKVLEQSDMPAWAYSIGLLRTFNHPEIIIFGQDVDLMHSMINTIGDGVRAGKSFEVDGRYPDLIEAYSCTFKPVHSIWFGPFLGFATWFYDGVGILSGNASGRTLMAAFLGNLTSTKNCQGRSRYCFMTMPAQLVRKNC